VRRQQPDRSLPAAHLRLSSVLWHVVLHPALKLLLPHLLLAGIQASSLASSHPFHRLRRRAPPERAEPRPQRRRHALAARRTRRRAAGRRGNLLQRRRGRRCGRHRGADRRRDCRLYLRPNLGHCRLEARHQAASQLNRLRQNLCNAQRQLSEAADGRQVRRRRSSCQGTVWRTLRQLAALRSRGQGDTLCLAGRAGVGEGAGQQVAAKVAAI
jgi:hypothetical protein